MDTNLELVFGFLKKLNQFEIQEKFSHIYVCIGKSLSQMGEGGGEVMTRVINN